MGCNVLSVTLGGGDTARYRSLVVFAADVLPLLAPAPRDGGGGGAALWELLVRVALPPSATAAAAVDVLRGIAGCTVEIVSPPLESVYAYSLERYRVHDRPGVARYVAVDSHYRWRPGSGIRRFRDAIHRWVRSGRPHMAYGWPGMRATRRPYHGGFFGGVPALSPIPHMGAAIDAFLAAERAAGDPAPLQHYGVDERFLGWLFAEDRSAAGALQVVPVWPSSATDRTINAEPAAQNRTYERALAALRGGRPTDEGVRNKRDRGDER